MHTRLHITNAHQQQQDEKKRFTIKGRLIHV